MIDQITIGNFRSMVLGHGWSANVCFFGIVPKQAARKGAQVAAYVNSTEAVIQCNGQEQ